LSHLELPATSSRRVSSALGWLLAASAALGLATARPLSADGGEPEPCDVSGQVVDAVSGEAIAAAGVRIDGQAVSADETGRFVLILLPGSWTVEAEAGFPSTPASTPGPRTRRAGDGGA
jgi:hypothetical protein